MEETDILLKLRQNKLGIQPRAIVAIILAMAVTAHFVMQVAVPRLLLHRARLLGVKLSPRAARRSEAKIFC